MSGEAARDVTLERYCCNVNSRADRSASSATDLILRGQEMCYLYSLFKHSHSLNHGVLNVGVDLSARVQCQSWKVKLQSRITALQTSLLGDTSFQDMTLLRRNKLCL